MVSVGLDGEATPPADVMRALPVVGLLLTGNPVCIVGAEATEMAERLAFIDATMSLLPYGMRAEMAASTWTRGTYQRHKFRLFFSEAPRRPPAWAPTTTWSAGALRTWRSPRRPASGFPPERSANTRRCCDASARQPSRN